MLEEVEGEWEKGRVVEWEWGKKPGKSPGAE